MPADFDVFRTVLYYSVAIIVLPISTFFTSKVIVFDYIFNTDPVTSNVSSAIFAVVMLHVALGIFIYKAYSTDDGPHKPEKYD